MRFVAVVLLLFPVLAWARDEPPSVVAAPLHGLAGEQVATTNAAGCVAFLSSRPRQTDGSTLLAVHIMTDGSISESRIIGSSGRGDIDRSALLCVSAMRLGPRTRNGIPVDVDWQVEVSWPAGTVRTAPVAGSQYACDSYYPATAQRAGREGGTLVSYVIGEDGNVSGLSVTESSGYRELDAAALACVSRFRYHPAMRAGKPVEVDGKFFAMWKVK